MICIEFYWILWEKYIGNFSEFICILALPRKSQIHNNQFRRKHSFLEVDLKKNHLFVLQFTFICDRSAILIDWSFLFLILFSSDKIIMQLNQKLKWKKITLNMKLQCRWHYCERDNHSLHSKILFKVDLWTRKKLSIWRIKRLFPLML